MMSIEEKLCYELRSFTQTPIIQAVVWHFSLKVKIAGLNVNNTRELREKTTAA